MCGIVYVRRHDGKPAAKSVRKRYDNQKTRGMEGFGYVAVHDNQIVSVARAQTEHEIMQKLERETAEEILFHHRMPTSGPNVQEMAHPILVQHGTLQHDYFIVHNGVISNSRTRKEAHTKRGFTYTTELREGFQSVVTKAVYHTGYTKFNDSESLAIDTALALELQEGIESTGSAAVVGLAVKDGSVVERFFYRNRGNPLYYKQDRVMTTLTSVGGGTEVPTTSIMRFDVFRKMEKHPGNIWSPATYEYATTRMYDAGGGESDDYSGYPGMGYGRPQVESMKNVRSLLPPATPKTTPPSAPVVNFNEQEEILEVDAGKLKKTIGAMPLDLLWEEFNDVTNALIELEGNAEAIDGVIELNNVREFGEAMRRRATLQKRIDKNKAYQAMLESEIKEREVFSKKLDKIEF